MRDLWLRLFGHLLPAPPPSPPPEPDGPDEQRQAYMAEAQAARDRAERLMAMYTEPKPQNPSSRPA